MADDSFWDSVGDIAKAAVALAVAFAAKAAVNSLFAGKQKAQNAAIPQEDAETPAIRFAGDYSRTAGAIVFRESKDETYVTISAASLGRLDSFKEQWLAQDMVTLTSIGAGAYHVTGVSSGGSPITDGRYVDDKCRWYFRLGAATETAYAEVTSRFGSSVWPSSARGDGVGSFCVWRIAPIAKFMSQAWPAGPSDASVSARGVCYDWRKDSTVPGGSGSHRRDDPATWEWSANPFVWTVFKEWSEWGFDWNAEIAPNIALLTDGANACETAVALHAGGTEPKYRCAFNYLDDEDQSATRARLLDAMDGWWTTDGFGCLVIRPGVYYTPTVTIGGASIESYSWKTGTANADAVDLINVTFMSPENDYKDVQCDPWRIGSGTRAAALDLGGQNSGGTYSFTQARRLAKRRAAQLMPTYRGWIKTGPDGRYALGERYIRIQNPRRASMADVVCEVTDIEYDDASETFTISLISADPNIDAWNPATEEGNPVTTVPGVAQDALPTPVILSATAVYNEFSDGSPGVSIEIDADSTTTRTDLSWYASWKLHAGTVWDDGAVQAGDGAGGAALKIVGPLPVNTTIDVRVEYITGGGSPSGWSAISTVSTSTAAVAPAEPTDTAAATGGGTGEIDLTWRNPSSANFDHVVIRRSTASDMSGATTLPDQPGGVGALDGVTDTGLTTGTTYYYDFAAANSSGTLSARTTPVSATAA